MAPASIVIDIVFIPVYALLSIGSVVNACKHRRSGGFIQLLLFALFRFVGTILLVYAYYSKTTDKNVYIAGGLFTGLGYSFLLTAVLSQFQRASSNTGGASVKGRARRPVNLLRTIATVSLILLIAGYSSYDGFAPSADGSSQPLPSSAKAGSILFVVTTVGETALLLYSFLNASSELKNRGDHEARLIVKLLLAAQPFLLVRIVYSTYLVVSDHPFSGNPYARLVCINITECIASAILMALGFILSRDMSSSDKEQGEGKGDIEEPPRSAVGEQPAAAASYPPSYRAHQPSTWEKNKA